MDKPFVLYSSGLMYDYKKTKLLNLYLVFSGFFMWRVFLLRPLERCVTHVRESEGSWEMKEHAC